MTVYMVNIFLNEIKVLGIEVELRKNNVIVWSYIDLIF